MIGFFVFHDDFLLKIELIFYVNSLAPFNYLDDGFISFKEYLKIMQDNYKEVDLEKERMKAAFRYIDKDNDGFLTLRELKTILSHSNSGISDEEIEQFFKEIDTDGDGKIDYEGAY